MQIGAQPRGAAEDLKWYPNAKARKQVGDKSPHSNLVVASRSPRLPTALLVLPVSVA
jgi:hypothetical protein